MLGLNFADKRTISVDRGTVAPQDVVLCVNRDTATGEGGVLILTRQLGVQVAAWRTGESAARAAQITRFGAWPLRLSDHRFHIRHGTTT